MERSRPPTSKGPTILDVAVEAGVSKSAVSRALLRQRQVSDETRIRVEDAAARLGYVANGMARGLVSSQTRMIGVVLRDLTRSFYGELLAGMQQGAEARGYQVITVTSAGELEIPDALRTLKSLISLQVDGLVISSARLPSEEIVPFVNRTPIVVSGRAETSEGITSIFSDEEYGGKVMADYVLGLGHRHIAVAVVNLLYSLSQNSRGSVMVERLREAGAEVEAWPADTDADVGPRVASMIDGSGVTAIMCPTDGAAVDVLEVLRLRGLSAPEDLTVTGYDHVGPLTTPFLGLTTYRVPVKEIGRTSVDLLVDKVEGRTSGDRAVSLRGTFIEGRTAGAPVQN